MRLSFEITLGLAAKRVGKSAKLARRLFFDAEMGDLEVKKWTRGFYDDSRVTIDLQDLAKRLPSGDAPPKTTLPCLVVGATDDKIVDREGVEEMADFFKTKAEWVESPHDVMLGGRWENGAYCLLQWLENLEGVGD